jgi:hypothetical protein
MRGDAMPHAGQRDPLPRRRRNSCSCEHKEQTMISLYRSIMDSNFNSLRTLPVAQRFQIMLFLSVMWTNIFCLSAGAWIWFGEIVVFHVLAVAGFIITGLIFRRAEETANRLAYRTYRHYPLKDGTARYDDVWGG